MYLLTNYWQYIILNVLTAKNQYCVSLKSIVSWVLFVLLIFKTLRYYILIATTNRANHLKTLLVLPEYSCWKNSVWYKPSMHWSWLTVMSGSAVQKYLCAWLQTWRQNKGRNRIFKSFNMLNCLFVVLLFCRSASWCVMSEPKGTCVSAAVPCSQTAFQQYHYTVCEMHCVTAH